jgi:hypothetical protein
LISPTVRPGNDYVSITARLSETNGKVRPGMRGVMQLDAGK